ncbi:MAG: hypothetical protein ACOC95_08955 [Planctomycetota bacterium]
MQVNGNTPGMIEPAVPDGMDDAAAPAGGVPQATRPPKISRSTIAMGVMFCAGVGIIIALSSTADPQPAAASNTMVEKQVEKFLAHTEAREDNTDSEGLIEQFYSYASRRQIPPEALRTTPFARSDMRQSPTPGGAETRARVASTQKRAALKREFETLSLQGIMTTANGATAIINGQFVTTGAAIGSFTVTAIHADRVDLTCEQIDFTLTVQR